MGQLWEVERAVSNSTGEHDDDLKENKTGDGKEGMGSRYSEKVK